MKIKCYKLKCYKLKLLPDINMVSGWNVKQYIKEKERELKAKEWSSIKILISGKHTSDGRIYIVANTKIKICKWKIPGVMQ